MEMLRTYILSVAPVMNMYGVSVRNLVQRSLTDRSQGDWSRICPFSRLAC